MVIALDFESNGPESNRSYCVVFLGETDFTLTVPLSIQLAIKWILVNSMLGVTLQWNRIPSLPHSTETGDNH